MLLTSQPGLTNSRPQLMNQGLMKERQALLLHQPVQYEQQRVAVPSKTEATPNEYLRNENR